MRNLVRVRHDDMCFNVGAALAAAEGYEVLDESAYGAGGEPKPVTRGNGRPRKTRTSVAEKAAEKKAATESADTANPLSKKEH